MKIRAFVPLRSGSKGIPLKNIKDFCGKPLCYWVINELQKINEIEKVVISSDNWKIIHTIAELIAKYSLKKISFHFRSEESANDTNHWEVAVLEYLKENNNDLNENDILIMTQVTSPFTSAQDFKNGIELYNKEISSCSTLGRSVVTCARIYRFVWEKVEKGMGFALNYNPLIRPRRQDFQGLLIENGAFCINSVGGIKQFKNRLTNSTLIYEMPEYTYTEIDNEDDWYYAEYLFKKYCLNLRI